jgi:hypothetical protein
MGDVPVAYCKLSHYSPKRTVPQTGYAPCGTRSTRRMSVECHDTVPTACEESEVAEENTVE